MLLILSVSCSNNSNNPVNDIGTKKIDSPWKLGVPKIISDPTNSLENKVQQLELEYCLGMCMCKLDHLKR